MAKLCPTCEGTYEDEIKFCPKDGTALSEKTAPEDPLVGRLLGERYQILDRLGAGGFGTVYRARDTRLDDIEALKVFDRRRLPPREAQDAMERFRREAKLLRKLGKRSEHIVGVTNFEEDPTLELFYFSMEYVKGVTLSQLLKREGPLDVERGSALTRQICQALMVAHEEGIVHRDLKLDNVMITRDGERDVVKVLDFGVAKLLGHGSLTDVRLGGPGTPGYAAPEQIEDPTRIDGRTDLFGLGVVMYAILTGYEPWTGQLATEPTSGGWMNVIHKTLEGVAIPPRKVRPDLPADFEALILQLLSKRPEDRPPSAEALDQRLAELEAAVAVSVPGTLTVTGRVPGVRVALKKGPRTVARGSTPWSLPSVAPGSYRLVTRDRRFEKEEREIEIGSRSEVEVALASAPRPGRRPVASYLAKPVDGARRVGAAAREAGGLVGTTIAAGVKKPSPRVRYALIALMLVPVVLLGSVVLWPRPATPLDYTAFLDHLDAGAVASVSVGGDHLNARVSADEGPRDYRVSLAGSGLQSLMQRIASARVEIGARGSGTVRVHAVDERSNASIGEPTVVFTAEGGGCAPCDPSRDYDLGTGWYRVAAAGGEWRVEAIEVHDAGRRYQPEVLEASRGPDVFLPPDGALELVARLARTPLGELLDRAREALAAGAILEPADASVFAFVDEALAIEPGNAAAQDLWQQAVAGFRATLRETLADGRLGAADALVRRCLARYPEERVCADGRIELAAARSEADRQARDTRVAIATPPARPAAEERGGGGTRGTAPTGRSDATPVPPAPVTGERADEASGAGGVEADAPAAPRTTVDYVALARHGLIDRDTKGLELAVELSTTAAAGTTWCAAVRFREADGPPLPDVGGRYALGGQVAATQEFRSESDAPSPSAFTLFLPVDELHRERMGQHALNAQVTVWDAPCGEAGPAIPPLATSAPTTICLVRYMFGWDTCR